MSGSGTKVAVIGAGRMGVGIAYVLAAAGHEVAVFDPVEEARAAVPTAIAELARQLGAPTPTVVVGESFGRAVAEVDVAIEAGPENLGMKREIFGELTDAAPATALLATNTSAIPIAEIAAGQAGPQRIMGTHFWNPPHLVSLVEVVEAERTDPDAARRMLAFLADAGMRPVHVHADIPGFIGNRLQHALKREAIAIVAAGHCDAEGLDEVVRYGFGARLGAVGPLEQSDLNGLDLTLAIHETLIPDLDRTPVPHPLLVEKVERGELGVATGRGFREWREGEADEVRARVAGELLRRRREESASSDRLGTVVEWETDDRSGMPAKVRRDAQ